MTRLREKVRHSRRGSWDTPWERRSRGSLHRCSRVRDDTPPFSVLFSSLFFPEVIQSLYTYIQQVALPVNYQRFPRSFSAIYKRRNHKIKIGEIFIMYGKSCSFKGVGTCFFISKGLKKYI